MKHLGQQALFPELVEPDRLSELYCGHIMVERGDCLPGRLVAQVDGAEWIVLRVSSGGMDRETCIFPPKRVHLWEVVRRHEYTGNLRRADETKGRVDTRDGAPITIDGHPWVITDRRMVIEEEHDWNTPERVESRRREQARRG